MNSIKHSNERLEWLRKELSARGIDDYRFCIQNNNYVCDINGNVFSICKTYLKDGREKRQYRILPIHGSIEDGYVVYRIDVNGVRKHLKGHRIMLDAWIGNQPNKVINHKDGNKMNNALSNLEWCTTAENNKHAIDSGLYDPRAINKRVYVVPKDAWITIYILHKYCNYSFRQLGQMNRCSRKAIENIYKKMDSMLEKVV